MDNIQMPVVIGAVGGLMLLFCIQYGVLVLIRRAALTKPAEGQESLPNGPNVQLSTSREKDYEQIQARRVGAPKGPTVRLSASSKKDYEQAPTRQVGCPKGSNVRLSTSGMTGECLFRFLWVGTFLGGLPFVVIIAALPALGIGSVNIGGQRLFGVAGVIAAFGSWTFATVFGIFIQWLMFQFGFWLMSKWGRITLEFKNCEAFEVQHAEQSLAAESR